MLFAIISIIVIKYIGMRHSFKTFFHILNINIWDSGTVDFIKRYFQFPVDVGFISALGEASFVKAQCQFHKKMKIQAS